MASPGLEALPCTALGSAPLDAPCGGVPRRHLPVNRTRAARRCATLRAGGGVQRLRHYRVLILSQLPRDPWQVGAQAVLAVPVRPTHMGVVAGWVFR